MPTYFITEVATREAMMSVKGAPERSKGVVEFAKGFGVTIEEFFFTMNEFDFIMKVQAPDEESVAAFAMAVRQTGNVTAKVSRAFTPEQWTELVSRLPG